MANPTISQITIGSNTYDVCDATARNLAIPKLLDVNAGWRRVTIANHTSVHSNQIIEEGHFPGTLFRWYGLQSELDNISYNTSESWGQYAAYIAVTQTNAGSDFNIADGGNSAVTWSPMHITQIKSENAKYAPCKVHTSAVSADINQTNYWRRIGGVTKGDLGGNTDLSVTYNQHFTGVYLYMPSSITDYTKVFTIATETQTNVWSGTDMTIYNVLIQENDTDI